MALGRLWWRALGFWCEAGRRDSFGVAGVALGDIYLHFAWQAWQAWHLVTSTFTLCGRRGTYGTGLALVARLVPVCHDTDIQTTLSHARVSYVPACPIPSSPFFGYFLEEVDMWGYPVLYFFIS